MTEDEMAGWHHQLNGHEIKCPSMLGLKTMCGVGVETCGFLSSADMDFGLRGRGRGWDDLGEWHSNMYTIM